MPTKKKRAQVVQISVNEVPPLKLTVSIPAAVTPLFRAMAEIHIGQHERQTRKSQIVQGRRVATFPGEKWSLSDVASHAVIRWMVSEEALENLDRSVNAILRS